MKLFEGYEAVRFPQENLIFITHDKYLYYIYNPKYRHWEKYKRAGWDTITVSKYPDIRKKDLRAATGGNLPEKESDLLRLLYPSDLTINNMFTLFKEDYPEYMHDYMIHESAAELLRQSEYEDKTYLALRQLFYDAQSRKQSNRQVIDRIRELSMAITGRNLFSKEIRIVDGHDGSSYFWIMPVRVLDPSNTNIRENVTEMRSNEISIEEDDVWQYLTPFLYKYFDADLDANKSRVEHYQQDDDGNETPVPVDGFEWYLTHNFFTYESIRHILNDINDTIPVLASGGENEFISQIREKGGFRTRETISLEEPTKEGYLYKTEETEVTSNLIIDFYNRFTYRMEYMMKVGKEKGYDLISFMGP